jgi:hypothetical protein
MSHVIRFRLAFLCVLLGQLLCLPDLEAADPKLPAGAKVLRNLSYVTNGHAK